MVKLLSAVCERAAPCSDKKAPAMMLLNVAVQAVMETTPANVDFIVEFVDQVRAFGKFDLAEGTPMKTLLTADVSTNLVTFYRL